MTDRYFSLSIYSSVFTNFIGLGMSLDAAAKMAGVPPVSFTDPNALITARQLHELAAIGRSLFSHDAAFCLKIGDMLGMEVVDVLGPLFATTYDGHSFAADCVRFYPLLDPCVDISVEFEGDDVLFCVMPLKEQGADARFLHAETWFSVAIRTIRRLFARPDVEITRIEMQHDGSAWADQYRQRFGEQVELRFCRPRNVLVMQRKWLDELNPNHSPILYAHSERIALERLAALPQVETFSARIVRFLEAESGRRVLDLGDVAEHLGITTRTLQRRLIEENTTFQVLRDGVRYRVACRLLQDQDCQTATIAAILGYSEPTAFLRAFKAWSGMSTSEYRRLQTGGD